MSHPPLTTRTSCWIAAHAAILLAGAYLVGAAAAQETPTNFSRQAEALRQQRVAQVQSYDPRMMPSAERLPSARQFTVPQFVPPQSAPPQFPTPPQQRSTPVAAQLVSQPRSSYPSTASPTPPQLERLPAVPAAPQSATQQPALFPTLLPRNAAPPNSPPPSSNFVAPPQYSQPAAVRSQYQQRFERLPPVEELPRVLPPAANFAPAAPAADLKFPKLEETIVTQPPYEPDTDCRATPSEYFAEDFAPTPTFPCEPYDAGGEQDTYGGKSLVRTQRPWVEWFRPMYGAGPIPPSPHWFGFTNPATPQFLVYGDYRAAMAYIEPGAGASEGKLANRLNLDMDLKLTATERIHAFVDPFTNGTTFSSVVVQNGDVDFVNGLNGNFQTLFFEGDLGAMVGGALGVDPPFDLPVTIGRIPLLFQNGIWMEDNLLGAAFAIPARNSPALDWSNYDLTFFAAIDEVTSPAFGKDDSVADIFGSHAFIEAYGGYLEVGYAFLDDHTGQGLSYHNLGVSFQRRYFNAVSNALRCIVNAGQDPVSGQQTADGVLFLMENVFITDSPYYKLPYANFFLGLDRPQSVARNAGAQGVLRNTGINFETDNLTNYPTLDATGNDVYGAAFGLDLLGQGFSQQLIMEAAVLQVLGDDPLRNAKGNQYAVGFRYQLPLSNSWIFRTDAMHGWRENDSDISGARVELRHKF